MEIKNENYIVVQGFMVNKLKLKGNELLVYAIIYGFSQIEGQKFKGSLSYLSKWLNSSKQTVLNVLKSLLDKKMILKEEKLINGIKFCEYSCNENYKEDDDINLAGSQKNLTGYTKNLNEGSQNFGHNNIYNNIDDNIDTVNNIEGEKNDKLVVKESSPKGSSSFDIEKFKELKEIVIKATGLDRLNVDNVMYPSKYRDIDLNLLLVKIKESDFLMGKMKTKPNINNFSVLSMINRILADGYKNKVQQEVIVNPSRKVLD